MLFYYTYTYMYMYMIVPSELTVPITSLAMHETQTLTTAALTFNSQATIQRQIVS